MFYKLKKKIELFSLAMRPKKVKLAMRPMKIKLIAVAKDEAAYIPEWVYHHLNFGFDSISIYTNNISDNTRDVIDKISLR